MNEFFVDPSGGVPPVLWLVSLVVNGVALACMIRADLRVRAWEAGQS